MGPTVAAVGEIGTAAGKLAGEVKSLHELEKRAFPGKSASELGGRPLMKLQTELDSQRYSNKDTSWLAPTYHNPTNEIQGLHMDLQEGLRVVWLCTLQEFL